MKNRTFCLLVPNRARISTRRYFFDAYFTDNVNDKQLVHIGSEVEETTFKIIPIRLSRLVIGIGEYILTITITLIYTKSPRSLANI